ncbi:NB-ARC domain-containing protein, partial [Streptomyces sp. NPDC048473]|uniref:NB-ARC domain-containing protein n=1 Tax=unclassified Streptomyces TaxID=2593676 RepID=UPI003710966E
MTTAIEGAGGFGKTTLAALVCHAPEVASCFAGGLLWVTVGERSQGPQLAEMIGGLCEVLSGDGVKTVDPRAAGGRLGELLDARDPVLLVIDDIWRPEQLAPFMIGGRSCRRLITTRNAGIAPRQGVAILVDAMTTGQAIATLTDGVADVPRDLLARLIAVTGHWPLLLSLVNATLTDQLAAGADVRQAVEWVLRRLETDGPAVFDVDLYDQDGRSHAVEATVEASLALLSPGERERYLDLAVLPEDTQLPAELLSRLWDTTGGMSLSEAERLRARLVRLRLVLPSWQVGAPAVGLHDILGSFLRHRLGDEQLSIRHEAMVRTAATLLAASSETETPWWTIPANAEYLWRHLPRHLTYSGRGTERDALVCDLRWVAAKATNLGSSVPVEVDLAEVPTAVAESLRRSLGTITHLLTPGDPPTTLDGTLYGYLAGVPELKTLAASYRSHLPLPQLVPSWPLPDQPSPSILRVLTGHASGVSHCSFSPDGALVATAGHDETIRVWNVLTGEQVQILTGHAGAVSTCVFSPDGALIATAGHDLTARLWDVTTG